MDSIDSTAGYNGQLKAILITALMDLQWWVLLCVHECVCVCVCVCSGHSVVFQVCAENCERLITWRRRLSSATTSPKAQLPRSGGRKLDRKPQQRRPHERLGKEQQLCGNRKGKVTAADANRWGFWLICWPAAVATMSSWKKGTRKENLDKHTNKHECRPGKPKRCSVASGDSAV